jgi:hypothetical protein
VTAPAPPLERSYTALRRSGLVALLAFGLASPLVLGHRSSTPAWLGYSLPYLALLAGFAAGAGIALFAWLAPRRLLRLMAAEPVRNATLALASSALTLYLGDLALLAVQEARQRRARAAIESVRALGRKDPVLHHSFIPGASVRSRTAEWDLEVRVNSHGFHDREWSAAKAPGVFRILMLGDSFTAGLQVEVEQTAARRLEALLNRAEPARRYEVLNLGVNSYSPVLEYLLLQQSGLALAPDLVILNLDQNDFQDDHRYLHLARLDAAGLPAAVPALAESRHSEDVDRYFDRLAGEAAPEAAALPLPYRATGWLGRRALDALYGRDAPGAGRAPLPDPGALDWSRAFYAWKYRYVFTRFEDQSPWLPFFRRTCDHLLAIQRLCASRGIPLLLALYPYPHQLGPDECPEFRRWLGLAPGEMGTDSALDRMLEYARAAGIPTLDTRPALRRARGPLHWKADIHWTPAGHAAFARELFRFLKERPAPAG